jgi:acyl-CoA reductase-like NAD-dependent aldehyde dehydrogenase
MPLPRPPPVYFATALALYSTLYLIKYYRTWYSSVEDVKNSDDSAGMRLVAAQGKQAGRASSALTVAEAPVLVDVHDSLVASFHAGVPSAKAFRRAQLRRLLRMVEVEKETILAAVEADLGKNRFESVASEYALVRAEIMDLIENLNRYMAPQRVRTKLGTAPASSSVTPSPKGVVLIMSPWNYPVNLALVPLAGAIAAGNSVFLKVSRHSSNVARVLCDLIPRYLDTRTVAVEGAGGASLITELLRLQWDHIFFTGSVSVGKVVAAAAARTLCPVTLELGGKNPCYIGDVRDLRHAMKRIVWGKFWNASQTCIGIDYLLVPRHRVDEVVRLAKEWITEFFGEDPRASADFARIVSPAAARRLRDLLDHGTVVIGGEVDVDARYVAPTVLVDVELDSPLMDDEIFGPLLPIVPCDSASDVVRHLRGRPSPLALYVFSDDKAEVELIRNGTRSGAFSRNHVLQHFINDHLPFGGVGESGTGAYHGERTFSTFSHDRATIDASCSRFLDSHLIYPPYTPLKAAVVALILRLGV